VNDLHEHRCFVRSVLQSVCEYTILLGPQFLQLAHEFQQEHQTIVCHAQLLLAVVVVAAVVGVAGPERRFSVVEAVVGPQDRRFLVVEAVVGLHDRRFLVVEAVVVVRPQDRRVLVVVAGPHQRQERLVQQKEADLPKSHSLYTTLLASLYLLQKYSQQRYCLNVYLSLHF
jgi:hypothetical protein